MANEELRHEIDTLKSDLSALRDDLRRLREAGSDAAESAIGEARERLESETSRLLERLREVADEATGTGRRVLDDVEHELEEHPVTVLLASFGIGVLVGWLTRRT